jgi:hypothetical protein
MKGSFTDSSHLRKAASSGSRPASRKSQVKVFFILGLSPHSFLVEMLAAASNVTTLAINYGDNGVTFKKGIVIAATTTATGSSAPAGNVLVTITYL